MRLPSGLSIFAFSHRLIFDWISFGFCEKIIQKMTEEDCERSGTNNRSDRATSETFVDLSEAEAATNASCEQFTKPR